MLHNETRKLLVQAFNKTHDAKEVAKCFAVDTSTVYRLIQRMNATGSVDTRTYLRGRKPSLNQENIQQIDLLIQKQPDVTLKEIIETLDLSVSDETVRKAILKLGYVYKKKSLHALKQERPRRERKEALLEKGIPEYDVNHLVFLDESGVNTDMTRPYARALEGQRAVDSTPVNTPSSTTVLSSVQIDGETAYTTYQGSTTAEKFAEYLKTKLFPTLKPDSIIIMDNMRSHHAKNVKLILEESGFRYLYLPPYSPDLNPIEKLWSKIKAFLRKAKVRNAKELPCTIKNAFATISQSDCQGWFSACGYMH